MKQNIDTGVLMFDFCSEFASSRHQALATCTFKRLHFRRGVVNIVLLSGKVQGEKSQLLATSTESM